MPALAATRPDVLGDFLRASRARLTRADAGLPSLLRPRRGPRTPGLTQSEVDQLIALRGGEAGVDAFQRFESGRWASPPEHYVDHVVAVLQMDNRQRALLYAIVYRKQPSPAPADTRPAVSALWRQIINSQHDSIALITDHRGDVLHHNDGFATMSPHTPPHNVFRWTLLSPEAREGTLRDWAGTWAQAAAFHLQLSQLTHPDDTRLTDLVSEVVCDPIAGPLYARVDHTRAFAAETWRLQHAQWGPGYVQMASAQPSSSHPTTVVFMPFHGTRL